MAVINKEVKGQGFFSLTFVHTFKKNISLKELTLNFNLIQSFLILGYSFLSELLAVLTTSTIHINHKYTLQHVSEASIILHHATID